MHLATHLMSSDTINSIMCSRQKYDPLVGEDYNWEQFQQLQFCASAMMCMLAAAGAGPVQLVWVEAGESAHLCAGSARQGQRHAGARGPG